MVVRYDITRYGKTVKSTNPREDAAQYKAFVQKHYFNGSFRGRITEHESGAITVAPDNKLAVLTFAHLAI